MEPVYRRKLSLGELKRRADELEEVLRDCTLCPHECHANRLAGRYGVCRTTSEIMISSAAPHYGEEAPLTGNKGSGTIFFSSCNLKCMYCQNYDISHLRLGRRVAPQELAEIMLRLQRSGCHNINLVSPTHVTPQIVEAIACAAEAGLRIPIVYNCGGYESVATLRFLSDIVDIYMPDIKYSDDENARRYSGAPHYWDFVKPAIREMHRQVGDLLVDKNGIAERGLLIRHLVLPNRMAGSEEILKFIAKDISLNSYVNIMDQYRPAYQAIRYGQFGRTIRSNEYSEVLELALHLGLSRGFGRA